MDITTFEQAELRLAESLPGYESRPQQQALARAIEASIVDKTPLLAEAGCGCIQGDAEIIVNRGGGGIRRRLRQVVEKFNGGGGRYPWDLSIPTYVQREAEDGTVRLARLVNAWCSGEKFTYTVTTNTGRTIRATDEHPFMTERGWVRLDELMSGDEVHVRGDQRAGRTRLPKPQYVRIFAMQAHPYANRFKNGSAMVPEHRLVAEAARNGMDVMSFVERVRSGDVEGLEFLDPAVWAVHHLNENPTNNELGNLKVMTHAEHHALHADQGAHVLYKVVTERVVSVIPHGVEMTYDLEVADDPHNFIANGFVVHNTGKSLATAIPAILSGKRTVISTATKALQDQVAHKDLPFLAEHLGVDFAFALLKGRSNYLCRQAALEPEAERVIEIGRVRERMTDPAFDGERDNLGFELANSEWLALTVSSEECPGRSNCAWGDECYAERAKERAHEADVVITNHALLSIDAQLAQTGVPGVMLGDFEVLIVDECFPAGTLVDGRPIEQLAVGDMVTAFDEQSGAFVQRRVNRLYRNPMPTTMVRVSGAGREVVSTSNHPYWTQRGWVHAKDLVIGDSIAIHGTETSASSGDDGMHVVQGPTHHLGAAGCQQLPAEREGVLLTRTRQSLLLEAALGSTDWRAEPGLVGSYARAESHANPRGATASLRQAGCHGASSSGSGRERAWVDCHRADAVECPGAIMDSSARGEDRASSPDWVADALQDRLGTPGVDGGRRGGRSVAQRPGSAAAGSPQGRVPLWARVDRVEVLERAGAGFVGDGGVHDYVYNIEVDEVHTYTANGVVVHNCHELESYARNAWTTRMTQKSFDVLLSNVRTWTRDNVSDFSDEMDDLLGVSAVAVRELWSVFGEGRLRQSVVLEHEDEWVALINSIQAIAARFSAWETKGYDRTQLTRFSRIARRLTSTIQRLVDIVLQADSLIVRWIETETTRRGEKILTLKAAPVELGPILDRCLWSRATPVLVSATLEIDGSFDYPAKRLGVSGFVGLNVGTPFDFGRQARIYVPGHIPAPDAQNRAAWSAMAIAEMRDLVRASDGRALLLFTSTSQMRTAYDSLSQFLPYTCLMQGQLPNKRLAEMFMEDAQSVLFATRSFFTGVDLQGEACSLVVIDKLPFPVPTEPLVSAQTELIEARGGNSFADFVIPEMTLPLIQGFGRLIRTKSDMGVVAILDPRLVTKGYGGRILRSLPPAPRVDSIDQVRTFFSEIDARRG